MYTGSWLPGVIFIKKQYSSAGATQRMGREQERKEKEIMEVYLDNSATTKCFEEAGALMTEIMCREYGNPSSLHGKGVQAEACLRRAKEIMARILKAEEKEIYFTSGGTESDNIALIGAAMANHRRGRHLITTRVEHPAVMQTMRHLEEQGFCVTYLPVDSCGRICIGDLKNAITRETVLVSIMHTNNEIGTLQPVEEAGAVIKARNPCTLFHVDAVQGFGKFQIHPKKMKIDLLSVSAHKIHGPKGVGMLYVDKKAKIRPIIFGGGQQYGLRSGTENVPGAAGMAKAAEMMYAGLKEDTERLYKLREYFTDRLGRIPDVAIHGPGGRDSAPHIVSASVAGVRSEVLLHALEDKEIYISAGSACAARKPQPSETLKAIGADQGQLESAVRFSFSIFTTREELDYTLETLETVIPMLRKYTRR